MAPTQTDQMLAEEIHELRRDFNDFRVEVAQKMESLPELRRDFNDFRVEVAQVLKSLTEFRVEVTQKLEALTVRMGDMLSVARWTIGILTPIIVTLIGSAFALTWYVAKLDSRMERVESSVYQKDSPKLPPQPTTPKPGP
jgi:hypothetical protein